MNFSIYRDVMYFVVNQQIKQSTQERFQFNKDLFQKSMQKSQNYIQIQVHNKIMQSLRQRQLEYKTKIIELQKQKQYEANRADEFQQRFKETLLHSGDQVNLIEKLSQKQNENNALRMELLRIKKSVDKSSHNSHDSKASNDLIQANKQLVNQNQQLARTIEELKNAAISAIMAKDDQIEDLNQKITKAQELAVLYQNLLDREENLQNEIDKMRAQAEQQQKALSQKLARQREKYLEKLQEFQNSLQTQQSSKQELLEKAQTLQNNLENKEQVIFLYQSKLNEFESAFRHQKQLFQQQKQKLSIQIDNLKDKQSLYEKEISNLQKVVSEYSFKQKQSKILNQRIKDQNAELERKLSIKKRKNNAKMRSSDIYSSFQGISQKSSFYSSFYKPTETAKPSNLGEIEELEENDVLDSFIDFQQRPNETVEDDGINYTKRQQTTEAEISPSENDEKGSAHQVSTLQPHSELKSQVQSKVPNVSSAELEAIKSNLQQNQSELKSLRERNKTLQTDLEQSYTQIQRLTKQILAKTTEIQNERQSLAQLRLQKKMSQSEKELTLELQNYKQHVYKLQNALLIEKLQNAEKEEFMKERTQRQRKTYEDKINKLDEEVKHLSPKKKKGFFR